MLVQDVQVGKICCKLLMCEFNCIGISRYHTISHEVTYFGKILLYLTFLLLDYTRSWGDSNEMRHPEKSWPRFAFPD